MERQVVVMQVPEYILIKGKNGLPAAYITPDEDGVKGDWVDRRLNAESTLTFSIPADNPKLAEITPECRIYIPGKNREYCILKEDESIVISMDDEGKTWATINAEESWKLLDRAYVTVTNDGTSPTTHQVSILSGGSRIPGSPYAQGHAGHALYGILQGSGWSVGTVDVSGFNDLETDKISILENINEIQNIWGGWLVWDSINKVVHLRDNELWRNYTGFQIRYSKNLKNISKNQRNRLVTVLYVYGKDDLNISSVNGGKEYLENFSYTSIVYKSVLKNPDIDDPQKLKDWGEKELAKICQPRWSYNAKIADVRVLPEYAHEDFDLGDMIDVVHGGLGFDDQVRIVRYAHGVFQPWNCDLDLGEPDIRIEEIIKAGYDSGKYLDNSINGRGQLSGSKLVDLSVTYKQLGLASVTTQALANLSVDITKLASLSVDVTKIIDGSITMPKLGDAAVGVQKIADQAVVGTKIALAAIATAHIQNGAIVNALIANLSVDSAKIADAAITSLKVANVAIGSAAIGSAAIGSAHIGNGVILSAHIGDAQIVSAKIGDLAVNTAKIADLAVTSLKIADLAVTNAKISSLSADKITAGTISASISISSPTITGGTVTSAVVQTAASGARVVLGENNSFRTYNANGVLEGLAFGSGIGASYGDVYLYNGGNQALLFYNTVSDGYAIQPVGSYKMYLGAAGKTTVPYGTWDCSISGTYFNNLRDSTGFYATRAWVDGNYVQDRNQVGLEIVAWDDGMRGHVEFWKNGVFDFAISVGG